jgi:hypothetical protein
VVQLGFRYGMILFIVSEVMFFLAFFWVALFFNIGNWIEDWQQFAFNGGQDCADKNKITSKIICFSKCWMSLLSLTYFFNSLHVISLPFSRLVFAFLSL